MSLWGCYKHHPQAAGNAGSYLAVIPIRKKNEMPPLSR